MLEQLIKNFYDGNNCLKDEISITLTQKAMIAIISEFAELKMNKQKGKDDEL